MEKVSKMPEGMVPSRFIRFQREEINLAVHERFEKMVELYPNSIALKTKELELTYDQLNRVANQLAHLIIQETQNTAEPITFLLEHGITQIIAILGISKTGHPHIALDPTFPVSRLALMISDSEAPLLVTNSTNRNIADELLPPDFPIINLDEIPPNVPDDNPDQEINSESIFTIQYTSGSTGQPKGCIKTHLQTVHDIYVQTNRRYLNPDDRYLLLLSPGFGASSAPIFGSLLNGASLFPYDIKKEGLAGLADFLRREKITIYYSVPSTFRHFVSILREEHSFPELRLLILGGETVMKKDLELFKKHFPSKCIFEVAYGGSEIQEARSFMLSNEDTYFGKVIPIGYAVEDKEILLLDKDGNQVSTGEIGEITVRSKYISHQYWKNPSLTATRFKKIPEVEGLIQYSTGDLGRIDQEGCLYHLGREDRQVKIRGHRVEIDEVKSALYNLPNVLEAHVKVDEDSNGETQLAAYVVPSGNYSLTITEIRNHLGNTLPAYMVPAEIKILTELPKTPSGKVNEIEFPAPVRSRSSLSTSFQEPQKEEEQKLVEIWEKLLDFNPIGIYDDFFELGGHSLLALRLIAEIEEVFGIALPFPALVNIRTISELAKLLLDDSDLSVWSQLVPLQPLGKEPPLFLVPPSAVTVMIFKDLAKYLNKKRPVYGIEYNGMAEDSEADDSILGIAKHNLEIIRSFQPAGPYYLGGMCFGGMVAFEMAKQLVEIGEEVAFLGILDSTHAPNLSKPRAYYVFMVTRFINQKILRQRFPIGMAPLKEAMKKFTPEDKFSNRIYNVFTTHNYARVKYITTPYSRPITLFNTVGSRGEFSQRQWKAVADGDLRIVSIPGVHANPREGAVEGEDSFIHEPQVQILAKKLDEELEKMA